jgi:hypothetical protein
MERPPVKTIVDWAEEPKNFRARKKIVDGKEILVIDPIVEEITHPDGRQDVIVHAPSLELIKQFKSAQNIE